MSDHGGWCCLTDALCHCGQVFDETHDREECHRRVPVLNEGLLLLSDYVVSRGGVDDDAV
jgi:hypothetical protein